MPSAAPDALAVLTALRDHMLCFACIFAIADALNNAITCTILAAAGPQRSRMLSQLYKDERSAALPVYPFLEKVYLERILRR
jgi:hypothetical protein